MRPLHRFALGATLLVLAAVQPATVEPAAAQVAASREGAEPEPVVAPFVETLDVEVINVDVYVTDRDGRPVTGLKAEDFRLFEDGDPVEITNFYAVEGGSRVAGERLRLEDEEAEAAPPAAALPPPEVEPLSLLVYVDNANLSPFSRNRLLGQLQDFLRRRLRQGDRVMLAGFDGGLEIYQGLTGEWKPLEQALATLAAAPATGQVKETVARQTLEEILTFNDLMRQGAQSDPCSTHLDAIAHSYAQGVFDDLRSTVRTLGGFVDSLSGLPGRKALLYVSDGLPLVAGQQVFTLLEQICGRLTSTAEGLAPTGGQIVGGDAGRTPPAGGETDSGPQWGDFNSAFDAQEYSAEDLFHDLARRANAQRVTLFTLEARGPRALPGASASASDLRLSSHSLAFFQAANFQDSLMMLADETGGRAVLDRFDFEPALEGIASDFDSHYSLGYSSPRRGDGRAHKLAVEVRGEGLGKGLQVRHRRSFTSQPADEVFADRTLGTLIFGVEENPLGIEARVGEPTSLDGSLYLVPIRLRIPLGKLVLLPEGGNHRGRLLLHLGARDRQGRLAPVRSAEIPITIPDAQLDAARGKLYLYEVKMLMREGEHSVAVGVRDETGGVTSYLRLEVPVAVAAEG